MSLFRTTWKRVKSLQKIYFRIPVIIITLPQLLRHVTCTTQPAPEARATTIAIPICLAVLDGKLKWSGELPPFAGYN